MPNTAPALDRATLLKLPPAERMRTLAAAQPDPIKPTGGAVRVVEKGADGMNKTERAYAQHLEAQLRAGHIRRWDFEPEKLKLAAATYYAPDFRVVDADGAIAMHEVKGFWRDDARVKIKVAASLHPYRFIAVHRRNGAWEYEAIRA